MSETKSYAYLVVHDTAHIAIVQMCRFEINIVEWILAWA